VIQVFVEIIIYCILKLTCLVLFHHSCLCDNCHVGYCLLLIIE